MNYYMFVYILQCSDGSYYTGVTGDLAIRLRQHEEGIDKASYTFSRRPLTLVYSQGFQNALDAIEWEKKIKKWSRAKKEALISGDLDKLSNLSKKKL